MGMITKINAYRAVLMILASRADGCASILRNDLARVLPKSLTTRMKNKSRLAQIFVDTFFILDSMITSPRIKLPERNNGLTKAMEQFATPMVRVRNYCVHQLADEHAKTRAMKSQPITGEFWELVDCELVDFISFRLSSLIFPWLLQLLV